MSLMLYLGGRIYSLDEWSELNESVQPVSTQFGTDGKNGEWEHHDSGWMHTFFTHKPDQHVLVSVHKHYGQVGFAHYRGEFTNDPEPYTNERTNLNDAFSTFGKVMHVALSGAKDHNLKSLRLKGADDRLSSAYDNFVKNKHLIKHMETSGYHYDGKKNNHHVFVRN